MVVQLPGSVQCFTRPISLLSVESEMQGSLEEKPVSESHLPEAIEFQSSPKSCRWNLLDIDSVN